MIDNMKWFDRQFSFDHHLAQISALIRKFAV